MRISFDLSDRDLRYFKRKMREIQDSRGRSESKIIEAASDLMAEIRDSESPDFVKERVGKLEIMIRMLEDKEWMLGGTDRKRVVNAMTYFAEADDLIPDSIPGIGFLDDAIMVELVFQELQPEIEAYEDFRQFVATQEKRRGKNEDDVTREHWIDGRRKQLHARMRRRRRGRSRGRGVGGPRAFTLW